MNAQPQVGAVFPQTELGGDPGAVRAWVQAVTELGYGHIAVFDHVVGADPQVHVGWDRPYTVETTFHEILVLFGFVAALTPLELVSSVVILPQRQTVLVAKQAAEIDLLTEGRFRLGVGIGWNAVEFEALGQRFSNRGARFEEQIELMRRLWTEPSVSFEGRYERVTGAGIRPLPVQRPIPVWIGGSVDVALARAGRLADGWFPQVQPGPEAGARDRGRARRRGRGRSRPGHNRHGGTRPGWPMWASTASPAGCKSGVMPAPPTSQSARWARAWPLSTITSRPSARRRNCWSSSGQLGSVIPRSQPQLRRPDLAFDQLDGVARGVSEIQRLPSVAPALLLLERDAELRQPASPIGQRAGTDSERDVTGAERAMGRHPAAGGRRASGVEDQQHRAVAEPQGGAVLIRPVDLAQVQHVAVKRRSAVHVRRVYDRLVHA